MFYFFFAIGFPLKIDPHLVLRLVLIELLLFLLEALCYNDVIDLFFQSVIAGDNTQEKIYIYIYTRNHLNLLARVLNNRSQSKIYLCWQECSITEIRAKYI